MRDGHRIALKTAVEIVRGDAFDVCSDLEGVDLVVTDPPYGRIVGEVWDRQWSVESYYRLGLLLSKILKIGGTAYVWGGIGKPQDRIFFQWLSTLESRSDLTLHNLITWSKKRAYGKADNYLFTREECAVIVKGSKPITFNIPLLETKRGYAGFNAKYPAKSEYLRRTNVWTDVTEIFRGKIHPTEKPSRLSEIMIETSSNPGELVVDMFAGSGSTGVAAAKLGRRCLLVEKSDCPMRLETGRE